MQKLDFYLGKEAPSSGSSLIFIKRRATVLVHPNTAVVFADVSFASIKIMSPFETKSHLHISLSM